MAKLKVDAVDGRVLKIKRKEISDADPGRGGRASPCAHSPQAIAGAGHTVESAGDGAGPLPGRRESFDGSSTWACPNPTACRCCAVGAPLCNMPVLILTARGSWR